MSNLVWMKRGERPTEPGWYWVEHFCSIVCSTRHAPAELVVDDAGNWFVGETMGMTLDEITRFAGPIEEPQEGGG